MKYLLKTTYPCLVRTRSEECELDQNETLEIIDEDVLFVYPEEPGRIPFYINLKAPKESDFLSIINHEGQTFLFLENFHNFQVCHKETLYINGKKCAVSIHGRQISFEDDEKRVDYICPHSCKNYKIFKIKDFACIEFDDDLYAYSIKQNKLSHFSGKMDVAGEVLTLTKQFFDSENRERRASYKFEDDITLQNESYVHNSSNPHDKLHNELVPYKFMESIRAKDFEFAYSFLSENLKNQIDDAQMREFFGNFSNFLPLSTTEFVTINDKQKKFVKFNMSGNFVNDIIVELL